MKTEVILTVVFFSKDHLQILRYPSSFAMWRGVAKLGASDWAHAVTITLKRGIIEL